MSRGQVSNVPDERRASRPGATDQQLVGIGQGVCILPMCGEEESTCEAVDVLGRLWEADVGANAVQAACTGVAGQR